MHGPLGITKEFGDKFDLAELKHVSARPVEGPDGGVPDALVASVVAEEPGMLDLPPDLLNRDVSHSVEEVAAKLPLVSCDLEHKEVADAKIAERDLEPSVHAVQVVLELPLEEVRPLLDFLAQTAEENKLLDSQVSV